MECRAECRVECRAGSWAGGTVLESLAIAKLSSNLTSVQSGKTMPYLNNDLVEPTIRLMWD
ncbi:hypothetical protein NBRC116494_28680 [Aurantivibrio plasticivorans]